MEKLVKLFEPGYIGKLKLSNRIVMAPLGHGMTFATKDGSLTDQFLAFYEKRAKGGVGFIQLTVAALGRPYATGLVFSPGILSISDDAHIESAARFASAIHKHGTKVSFNITHHGTGIARVIAAHPSTEFPELNRVITSTGTKDPITGFETFSMTKEDIQGVTVAFGEAAKRGQAAGFDAVRIQACHAYLLRQFLSPRINKRTDDYGGTPENRARFACEIIREVRKQVGPDYPIVIRMNGWEHLDGGITMEESVTHARLFEQNGVDCIDVSSGPPDASHWQYITMYQPYGSLLDSAAAIKKAVKIPVMAVGKLDAITGEKALREGAADFIQMGRALMADPYLPNKARDGRLKEIRTCIYCGHCQSGGTAGALANCTVNPAMGRELTYRLEPAVDKKKVVVIGGGPAGMEAAQVMARRGHQVSLYEKTTKLGGQWRVVAGYIPQESGLIDTLSAECRKTGVKIFTERDLTPEMVRDLKPDCVIVATGSKPAGLNVQGARGKNVVQAIDVLSGKAETGQEIVVIGGRTIGLSAAIYLAEKGKQVTVATRGKIARGIMRNQKGALIEYLTQYGVRLYPDCTADSISENGVNIVWHSGDSPLDNLMIFLKAETVVLAVGSENENQLGNQLKSLLPDVHIIGDASGKRSIFGAMREGSEVARKI